MELYKYYNLSECMDIELVMKHLKKLKGEDKIIFTEEYGLLTIEDFGLEDNDIEKLIVLFDNNDVLPDLDKEDDDDEIDDFPDFAADGEF
jgi:hypothetical protein